jgi:hypothetical protein
VTNRSGGRAAVDGVELVFDPPLLPGVPMIYWSWSNQGS